MIVAIAIQHDFAYCSYCVSATGSDTWPRLVYDRKEHDCYCIGSRDNNECCFFLTVAAIIIGRYLG